VKEIPLPDLLALEDADDLFGDDEEVAGLLGSLPLDEPDEEGIDFNLDDDDEDDTGDIVEPTAADLLVEDDDADAAAGDIIVADTDTPDLPKPSFEAEPEE
jgi:hypothetical protein